MGLFPPWNDISVIQNQSISKSIGYGFIISPPKDADKIDYTQLLIQWIFISIITSVVAMTFKDPDRPSELEVLSRYLLSGKKLTVNGKELTVGNDELVAVQDTESPETTHGKTSRIKMKLGEPEPKPKPKFKFRINPQKMMTRHAVRLYLIVLGVLITISLIGMLPIIKNIPFIRAISTDREQIKEMTHEINLIQTLKGHNDIIRSIAWSPDGKFLASGSYDNIIKLWDLSNGEQIRTFRGHTERVLSIDFSPNSKNLISGSKDKTIKLWKVSSGLEIKSFREHDAIVRSVKFSPNGRYIASGSGDKTAKIWNVATGIELYTLSGHHGQVWSVAFSPNGRLLATGSESNNSSSIKIWRTGNGDLVKTLEGSHGKALSLDFHPDNSMLACAIGGWDEKKGNWIVGKIDLWNVPKGQLVKALKKGISSTVVSVDFSPDGELLASGNNDRMVRLWDVKSRREIASLRGHSYIVSSVKFNPNGKMLASASGYKASRKVLYGEIKIWGPIK